MQLCKKKKGKRIVRGYTATMYIALPATQKLTEVYIYSLQECNKQLNLMHDLQKPNTM